MEYKNQELIKKHKLLNLNTDEKSIYYEGTSQRIKTKLAYKKFIREILEKSETVLVFTLTFNDQYKVSLDQAEKDSRHFKNTLDKDVFGKSNNRWKNRHPGCLVIEGNDYNEENVRTHIHGILGFEAGSNPAKGLIIRHWEKIKKSGFVIEINEWDGHDEWIYYILKQKTKEVPYSDAIAVLDRSNN